VVVLEFVLGKLGRSWSGLGRMLEFACGYGRTTRFLVERMPAERIVSVDILAGGVEWVRGQFGVGGFVSCTDPSELVIEGKFDLIWVGSLFSHLPRGRFEQFLKLLYGALTPEGVLVFSTHGADKVPSMEKDDSGFSFHRASESRSLALDEYGSTFVTAEVLREIGAACGVAHLARVDRHLWTIQDVWVASPAELVDFGENAPVVRGDFLRVEVTPEGHGWVGGFARIPAAAGPIDELRLSLGGASYAALLDAGVVMESTSSGELERFWHHEWYLEGPLGGLPGGVYPVCATATPRAGPRLCFAVAQLCVP